jgi:hypothetical protein
LPNRITPFEAWYGRKPTLSHYRVIGCDAWYHVPKKHRRKLQFKGRPAIFVGYATSQKAYKLWDPVSRKVFISRTVIFDEKSFTLFRGSRPLPSTPVNREVPTHNRFDIFSDDSYQTESDDDFDNDKP